MYFILLIFQIKIGKIKDFVRITIEKDLHFLESNLGFWIRLKLFRVFHLQSTCSI